MSEIMVEPETEIQYKCWICGRNDSQARKEFKERIIKSQQFKDMGDEDKALLLQDDIVTSIYDEFASGFQLNFIINRVEKATKPCTCKRCMETQVGNTFIPVKNNIYYSPPIQLCCICGALLRNLSPDVHVINTDKPGKIISITHLQIGDMVIGMHKNDKAGTLFTIVAGKITDKNTDKDYHVTYNVSGKTLYRSDKSPIEFSGTLDESEIEVIDRETCNTIIGLYNLANEQTIARLSNDTVEKINKVRRESRLQLEDKYAFVEAQ